MSSMYSLLLCCPYDMTRIAIVGRWLSLVSLPLSTVITGFSKIAEMI
jgi:hypothetical protein